MAILELLHRRRLTPDAAAATQDKLDYKQPTTSSADFADSSSGTLSLEAQNEKENQLHPDSVTKDAQIGQKKAEAAALIWGKTTVWFLLAWIWVCFFMLAFQSQIFFYSTAYVYASNGFSLAPEYTIALQVSQIVGAVIFLPLAKIFNLWGRSEAFLIELFIYVLGMIISASASSTNAYAAGYVIYYIGFDTLYNTLQIFVADLSGLRNRAFAFAFVQTPFICTAFTGPLAAQAFLAGSTWQWSIGAFCIIQPIVFLPLVLVFNIYSKRAEKEGLLVREKSGRTVLQSIVHYFHEFDIIGVFILMAAFVLFLLPFSLVASLKATYGSATFIAMLVIGLALFPVFYFWEKYGARTHFLRWELLQERTFLGAVLAAIFVFMAFYCWDLWYYSFVSVVYNLSVVEGGYMSQIYNVGSTFWAVVIGVLIRTAREFKYITLGVSVVLLFLGTGLSIRFRGQDGGYIGYTVMTQILIAFGGGGINIGNDMAVMAASDRENVPMALSILFTVTRLGSAIGTAIGTAIYNDVLLRSLTEKLPGQPQLVNTIYLAGYSGQQLYAEGTPERDAANYAWAQVMYYSTIAATSILVLVFPCVAMWKHYRLDKKQNKGTVI